MITATTRLLARSMRATTPRVVTTHPAPAPTATSDGTKRRSPGANWNGNGPSLILATRWPVLGQAALPHRCRDGPPRPSLHQPPGRRILSADREPADDPVGARTICTTSRSRHAPTDRVPAPSSSGPPPWPTSICAVIQRFGRTEPWGGARIVASVGRGWEAGSSGLIRPTTASTATAPSTAALTRSLSCREAMDRPRSLPARREPSAARHPAAELSHCFLQGHRSRYAHSEPVERWSAHSSNGIQPHVWNTSSRSTVHTGLPARVHARAAPAIEA